MSIKAIITANTIPGPKRVRPEHPDIFIMLLTEDPSVNGLEAPQGSMGAVPTSRGCLTYYKWGAGDYDWHSMVNRKVSLEYIGLGTGPNKTTTVVDGPVIAEEFQVGKELWFRWGIPDNIIPNEDIRLRVHYYINANEPGKNISWQLDIGNSDSIPVNAIVGTEYDLDVPVSAAYIDAHADFILTNEDYDKSNVEAFNFKLTRIASSNDPTAHARVHLITLQF